MLGRLWGNAFCRDLTLNGRCLHSSTFQLNISTICGLHASTFQFDVITFGELSWREVALTETSQVEVRSGRCCGFSDRKRLRLS